MIKVLKSLIIAFVLTVIGFLILAFFLSYTSLNEEYMKPICYVIVSVSIFISSFIISKTINEKGMLYGGIIAITYMGLLYVISFCICREWSLNIASLIFIGLGILSGGLGGILGINI